MSDPIMIPGGIAVDDRGAVVFVNDFSPREFQRMYVIKNHATPFIRAWHGHQFEAKAIFVVNGSALVGAVRIDDWNQPSRETFVHRVVLTSQKPSIFMIPAGYANGIMTLTPDTVVCVFSTATLEASLNDDYRFPSRFWDIWNIEER